ncbi:MAG: hypothetical protein ACLT2Y_00815 [Ruminococcus sp.]|nr:hypothetical protein [Ruminococcus bromii]
MLNPDRKLMRMNIPENTANGIEYINPANNSLGNRVKNRASDD